MPCGLLTGKWSGRFDAFGRLICPRNGDARLGVFAGRFGDEQPADGPGVGESGRGSPPRRREDESEMIS
jgi:hypothetical protein